MFALKYVAGFVVVERGRRRAPFDEREIEAVVFRVTLGATLAGVRLQIVGSMQSAMRLEPSRNLGVALQALQFTLGANLVTRCAVGRPF